MLGETLAAGSAHSLM
uniref:Uncharacterized protein n=1 Tax=Arundo donax TaxID=35708 RepID=A0A0A9E9T2_ARUDO